MLSNLEQQIAGLAGCPCGRAHNADLHQIVIGHGVLAQMGTLLTAAGAGKRLHAVADKNTLHAASGIEDILKSAGFSLSFTLYDDLQNANTAGVERVMAESGDAAGILSIGTGSLNDICRLASFRTGKTFYIFATAPSMDGFASNMAPITENNFKRTLPAKAPDAIFADTAVLAAAPAELKAAGFGDLLGKFTALCDWEIATLTTGEYYCPRIAALTKNAVDRAVALAGGIRRGDEESAAALMEALVLSGLAMRLSGSTRPASGAEHHLAHFWEMQYILAGRPPVFHGKKVGIACGLVADVYRKLAAVETIKTKKHVMDHAALKAVFGPLYMDIVKENTPDPLDKIPPEKLVALWPDIRAALKKVPTGDEIRRLLTLAGGAPDCKSAGISEVLERQALQYGYYVRFRVTMMRITGMMDIPL